MDKKFKVSYFSNSNGLPRKFNVPAETEVEAYRIRDVLAFNDLHMKQVGVIGDYANSVWVEQMTEDGWIDMEENDDNKVSDIWEDLTEFLD